MTSTRGKSARGGAKSQSILANQILDIVRDKRMERGDRLAEITLAEQLGVSRTPVRSALKRLAQEGIVQARPNQGFSLLRGWVDLKNTTLVPPTTTEEELYMSLIRDRIAGGIGSNVTQAVLLEHYRTNRSVLIRTLGRMAEEGLVTKNKGHGWTFMPSIDTAVALRNSYDFRLAVEPSVFRLETFRIDLVALDRMRSRHMWLLEQGDALTATGHELFEIDAQFHETMTSFGENAFFLQAVQHQNRLRRLLEYRGYANVARIRGWVREHLEIMDAIRDNDLAAAETRMRQHLQNAYRAATNLPASGRVENRPGTQASPAQVSRRKPRGDKGAPARPAKGLRTPAG